MGLTADDLQAIREVKGVEQAQPVYSMDALCDVDGSQKVVHIFSSQDGINELKVEKGRMPERGRVRGRCRFSGIQRISDRR